MRPALAVTLLCSTAALIGATESACAGDRPQSAFEMAQALQTENSLNGPFQPPIQSNPPAKNSPAPQGRKSNTSDFELNVTPPRPLEIPPPSTSPPAAIPPAWTSRPDDCVPMANSVLVPSSPAAPAALASSTPLRLSEIPALPPARSPISRPVPSGESWDTSPNASKVVRASNSEVEELFGPPPFPTMPAQTSATSIQNAVSVDIPPAPSQSASFTDPMLMTEMSTMGMDAPAPSPIAPCDFLCPEPDVNGKLSPYINFGSQFGNNRVIGGGGLFLPLWQDAESVLFTDLQARGDDHDAADGYFGLGYRQYLDPNWIWGVHGYYDLSHTPQGHNFNNGIIGIELFSLNWEFRLDGYIPDSGGRGSNLNAGFSNGNIVSWNFQERAYRGFSWEVGNRFLHWGWNDKFEVRWFLGSYYFDSSNSTFPSFAGPAGRLELRVHDLGWMGHQSRLDVGIESSTDRIRNEQIFGYARVQIPLGGGKQRPFLDPLRRHLLDSPLRRLN